MFEDLDHEIRAELNRSMGGSGSSPDDVLKGLTPRLNRARRAQQLRMAGTGMAVVLAVSVGGSTLMGQLPGSGEAAIEVMADSAENPDQPAQPSAPANTSPAMGAPEDTTQASADADTPEPTEETLESVAGATASSIDDGSAPTTVPGGEENGPPSEDSTTTPTTTTSSDQASTSAVPSGEQQLSTDCGVVTITTAGEEITLVRTDPFDGFESDIDDSGPETVEVSFESERGHCELEAEIRDGQLWTDIDNEMDDE